MLNHHAMHSRWLWCQDCGFRWFWYRLFAIRENTKKFVCHEDLSKYANILKVVYLRPFGVNRWYRMLLPLELCFLVLLRCFKYVFPWIGWWPLVVLSHTFGTGGTIFIQVSMPKSPIDIPELLAHFFWGAFFGSNMPRYPTHTLAHDCRFALVC